MRQGLGLVRSSCSASATLAKRSKAAAAPALPSREELVSFITKAPGKVGKRDLAKAFDIKGGDRIWLKQMLKDLEEEGVVDRRKKALSQAGRLPNVVLADIKTRDRDGELVAEPAEWDAEAGPTPKILVTMPRKPRPGTPVPGIGDRALLRVNPMREDGPFAYAGRVVKIVAKQAAQVLGIFHPLPHGGGRIVPVEKRGQGRELLV